MRKLAMIAMIGALTFPGISKASVCVDQFCRDKAFSKFESTVLKANGAYLNGVNKALAGYVINGDSTKANAIIGKDATKFVSSINKAEAAFAAKTGFGIVGNVVPTLVLLQDEFNFVWVVGTFGGFGY